MIRKSIYATICEKCSKQFRWYEYGGDYLGGKKDMEPINCPYCGTENGIQMMAGFIETEKIDGSDE